MSLIMEATDRLQQANSLFLIMSSVIIISTKIFQTQTGSPLSLTYLTVSQYASLVKFTKKDIMVLWCRLFFSPVSGGGIGNGDS